MNESQFITPKNVMALYGVTYRMACYYMATARERLGKRPGVKKVRGSADPMTLGEFKKAMNITQ